MSTILLIAFAIAIFYFYSQKSKNKKGTIETFGDSKGLLTVDDKFNIEKVKKEKELNRLLDKVNKKGIENLSTQERNRLDELSK